ncbi:nucleotide exchange factor GrpE [Alloscardovia omnicolens]|uniref:nucleotide exchange factor GrpE n=1 Tax=Alloscardovia omnicolens TaxID=419015 RepID=UPI0006658E7A|nr:nucleotide exchange factor GrpE [Alloscardovia omnicolens]MDK6327783.1 nucleotide exchange factor GrpE [Alloscardovia omnicolens]MDK8073994.1 nucleotide exchange factor GrpE [Alloscardovia omnicolens]MDK8081989.1 nucleotide exchange factor GrpE [Alloscardovia omnicolens]
MSEFNAEDYVNGMDDVDKLANQEKVEQTDHTSPAEQVEETEKASEPSQENSQEQSQDDQSQDAGEDSLTPLGKAKAEAAEYLESLQRERAAFVNFRNRVSKEQDRYREHGVVDVLTALLPALDDIDRIRANSQMDDSFKAVAAKIDKTFEKFGVEKFGEAGEDFDPTHHEGILRKPDADASHETVDTVVEAGYKIGDRVIRAARVVVAVPQDNE